MYTFKLFFYYLIVYFKLNFVNALVVPFHFKRWVTNSSGILSYYQNEEEVNSGAKASIRVSSCEITLDQVDNRR